MVTEENNIKIIRPYYPCLRGPATEGANAILMQLSLSNLCKKIIRENKVEIVLGYNMIPEGIAAVNIAMASNLPVAIWAIGTDVNNFAVRNRLNLLLARRCILRSSVILTESNDLESKVKKISPMSRNISTFYKGIDLSNFHHLPSRSMLLEKLGLDPDRKYILFAGRIMRGKGVYELAAAFRCITERYDNIDLILVGEEIEKDELMAKFAEYEITEKIHFRGIVPYQEVALYMRIAELLLFPTWAEGLPNVVMEAMASGLPVVASNVGGIPEILKNGVTGLSVPPKNVEKLTEAAITMIEDRELRERCIRNAKELIFERFDVKKNVVQLFDILKKLTA